MPLLKKIIGLPGLIIAALLPGHVNAQSADHEFTVQVTLAGVCEAINSGTQTVDFGVYSAFQATAQNSSEIELSFRCTRGLMPVSVAFDSGTGQGMLQGLQYALTALSVPVTQAGYPATASSIGSADITSYRVSGSMPAHQAGSCPAASCGPAAEVRTLVMTY